MMRVAARGAVVADGIVGRCAVLLLADTTGRATGPPIDARWPALAELLGEPPLAIRPTDPLWPHLGRMGNVALPLRARSRDRRDRAATAAGLIELCGLEARGEVETLDPLGRRLLLLARALAASPRPIVLDRLSAGLDDAARTTLAAAIRRVVAAHRAPVLNVVADRTEALLLADLVAVAAPGDAVIALAPPARLLALPPDLAVARCLAGANLLPARAGDPDDEERGALLLPSGNAVPARWAVGVDPGAPCVLAIDPARIAFAAVPAASLGFHALPATLTEFRHCGTHLRLTVQLADGAILLVHRPPGSLGPTDARAAAAEPLGASISWHGGGATAFPRPSD